MYAFFDVKWFGMVPLVLASLMPVMADDVIEASRSVKEAKGPDLEDDVFGQPLYGFSWHTGLEVTFGGDKLIRSIDEGKEKPPGIDAGGFVHAYVGIQYEFMRIPLIVQSSVGFHLDDQVAAEGKFVIRRAPIELLLKRRHGNHSYGGGVSQHLSPKYDNDVDVFRYKDATGYIAEYSYWYTETTTFNLRYQVVKYEVDTVGGQQPLVSVDDVDASYIGLGAQLIWK